MTTAEKFLKLEELYKKIAEGFYSYSELPAGRGDVRHISNDPNVSTRELEELIDLLEDINDYLSIPFIQEIIDHISEGSPIYDLCEFNVNEYVNEKVSEDLSAFDENLGRAQDRYQNEATEIFSKLLENAIQDIEYLIENALPNLLQVDVI